MDSVTQQNAALVEQAAAATAALEHQAAQLVEVISIFKLDYNFAPSVAKPRPAPAIKLRSTPAAPEITASATRPAKVAETNKAEEWETF